MLSLSLCVFMCRKVNFMGISRKHTSLTLFVVSGQDLRYRYPPPWDKDTGIDLCRCTYLTPAWRLCKIRCMWYCGRMEAPIEHRRNQYEESRRTVNSEAICIFRRTLGLLLNAKAFQCLRSVIRLIYPYENKIGVSEFESWILLWILMRITIQNIIVCWSAFQGLLCRHVSRGPRSTLTVESGPN